MNSASMQYDLSPGGNYLMGEAGKQSIDEAGIAA
jgi:hypothetical protein